MRKLGILGLVVIACSAWSLASVEERKLAAASPEATRQLPPGQARLAPGERTRQDEQNKAIVRRVFDDLLSGGRYELVDRIYARNCPVHLGNKHARLAEAVAEGKGWRQAAPDLRVTVDEMSAQGNTVSVSWTARGTNTGQGNGIRPTGKRVVIHGRSEFRMVNGKVAEVWNHYDRDDLFRQIGVNPRLGRLFDQAQELRAAVTRIVTGESSLLVSPGY